MPWSCLAVGARKSRFTILRTVPSSPAAKPFHCRPSSRSIKNRCRKFLTDHFAELLPLVEVREKVEVGEPAASILAEAEKAGSDLIVMSAHGRTGLAHLLMGSVTEEVVRNAVCPVFSVHAPKKK